MNEAELIKRCERDLTLEQRAMLAADRAVKETLATRLSYCGIDVTDLPRPNLGRLVRGHLQDILERPQFAWGFITSRPVFKTTFEARHITDEDVDRKFGHALQSVPLAHRATIRARLRNGMALDCLPPYI
jgi:hypothetical protein